jgi:hypothetical protein
MPMLEETPTAASNHLPQRDTGSITQIFWWCREGRADKIFYVCNQSSGTRGVVVDRTDRRGSVALMGRAKI